MQDALQGATQDATRVAGPCVFGKALLAQQAGCAWAQRQAQGERLQVVCGHAPARLNCDTLAALLRERARFALKLPAGQGAPLLHAQALRLQCGGLQALARHEAAATIDVHALVQGAQAAHGSLLALDWAALVQGVAAWQPRRRRGGAS